MGQSRARPTLQPIQRTRFAGSSSAVLAESASRYEFKHCPASLQSDITNVAFLMYSHNNNNNGLTRIGSTALLQISFVEFSLPTSGDYDCVDSDSLQVTISTRFDCLSSARCIDGHNWWDAHNFLFLFHMQITEPMRGRFELTETLCGVEMPKPIMSEGNRMRIDFKGRLSGSGNRGFKADYSFLESEFISLSLFSEIDSSNWPFRLRD